MPFINTLLSTAAKAGFRRLSEQVFPPTQMALSDSLVRACKMVDLALNCQLGDTFPDIVGDLANRTAFMDLLVRAEFSEAQDHLAAAVVASGSDDVSEECWGVDPIVFIEKLCAEALADVAIEAQKSNSLLANWWAVVASRAQHERITFLLEKFQILQHHVERTRSASIGTGRGTIATSMPLDNVDIYEVLATLYPDYPLMQFKGAPTAIWSMPAPRPGIDVDSVLATPVAGTYPRHGEYSDQYDRAGEQRYRDDVSQVESPQHFNGRLYTMNYLTFRDGVAALECGRGRFFDAQATSWALHDELIGWVNEHPRQAPEKGDLGRRDWVHKMVQNPVVDGSHRCAEIAISTLVLTRRREGGWQMLVAPRSGRVKTERFHFHVAPSGKFAPALPRETDENYWFSVRQTVNREFLEECCGYDDLSRDNRSMVRDLGMEPPIRTLENMLTGSPPSASLHYTGVAVNLLNLQPEVCTLLMVDDPDWIKGLKLNWEFAEDDCDILPKGVAVTGPLPLDDHLVPTKSALLLTRGNLVPVGAAAIEMGVRLARNILNIATSGD